MDITEVDSPLHTANSQRGCTRRHVPTHTHTQAQSHTSQNPPTDTDKDLETDIKDINARTSDAHISINALSSSTPASAPNQSSSSSSVFCFFRLLQSLFGLDPIVTRWKLIDSIQRTLPFTRELPADAVLSLSFVIVTVLVSLFLTIFLLGYMSNAHTTFLSPYNNSENYSNSDTGKYCEQVLSTVSGNYLATQTGEWEGNPLFAYSNASYQASVTSFSISFEEYEFLMNQIYNDIAWIGQQQTWNSLTYNLIYWMTAVFVVPQTTTQRFMLTGNPVTVFNRQYTGGLLSGAEGPCSANVTTLTTYDSNSGIIELSYKYSEFMQNSLCVRASDPSKLGYIQTISTGDLSLKIDVRSLITAIAVNIGLLSASDLVAIPGYQTPFYYGGITFAVSKYYNPKFPNMMPMVCVSHSINPYNSSNIYLCGLGFGSTYAIPIFNHFGSNATYPTDCDCSDAANLNLSSPFANCNMFNFISGVMFWNSSDPTPILELLMKFDFNYTKVNYAAFTASFMDSYWGLVSPYRALFESHDYRYQAYSFCNTSFGLCSMAIFSSFDDEYQTTWAVSENYYILLNGACRDTITPTRDNWKKLIDFPFAPLVESYQKCRYSRTVLFLNQAGIAMGNASLLAPIGALLVVCLYYLLRSCKIGKTWSHPPYSRVEIDRTNYSLGLALLFARDGKLPGGVTTDDEKVVQSVVATLSHDLSIAHEPNIMPIIKLLNSELSHLAAARTEAIVEEAQR